jgi:hypothetical protein
VGEDVHLTRVKSPRQILKQRARVSEFLDLSAKNPDREIAVIFLELVEHKWYH